MDLVLDSSSNEIDNERKGKELPTGSMHQEAAKRKAVK